MTSVLVVDDDAQLRSALARELADQGMAVEVAPSVEEAVTVLGRMNVDVLVTDLRMSDRDGIDLLTTVRETSSHTRTILMSAYASAKDYQTAIELGAVKVLCKPFTPSEMLDAVRQAIDCSTGFRGSLHGLSLIDMLQMFHYGRRSLCLTVGSVPPGTICFKDGEIVHAQRGDVQGEDALRAILAAKSGSVSTTVGTNVPRTIERSFQGLLLDLLRQMDESAEPEPVVDFEFDVLPHTPPGIAMRVSTAPPPSLRPGAPNALHSLVSMIGVRADHISPELSVAVVELPTGEVSVAAGPLVPGDVSEDVRALLEVARRILPGAMKIECVGDDTAFALVDLNAIDRAPSCTLFVGNVLVGRYAALKFRSDVGRLFSAIAANDIQPGGSLDGKD